MRIRQFSKKELASLSDAENGAILIVEQQAYGHDDDLAFNAVMSDDTNEMFDKKKIGRLIKDTGRTVGFFQNLGASGTYKPEEASYFFPKRVGDIIASRSPARISIEGATWAEILPKVPFLNRQFFDSLQIESTQPIPKKQRKNKKRSGQNVQSESDINNK